MGDPDLCVICDEREHAIKCDRCGRLVCLSCSVTNEVSDDICAFCEELRDGD